MSSSFVVPYAGQGSVFDAVDVAAVSRLLLSEKHLSSGQERGAFEAEFAASVGAAHAVSVTSCTMALELATHLFDLGEGDEVIVSPLTFQATATPLLGRPVAVRFGDVDEGSLALSADTVEPLIGPRTRAIYVTHYGGLAADLGPLVELARAHELLLLEDCAHALGTLYRGQPVGTLGDVGCWSFHSLKNMSTLGQGGMVTTADPSWALRLRRLRAMEPDADFVPRDEPLRLGDYDPPRPGDPERHAKNAYTHDCTRLRGGGMNAIMAEPSAAVGRTQLRKLPAFVARRRHLAGRLNERLGAIPGIRPHGDMPTSQHAYHLYTFRLVDAAPGERDELIRRLHHEHGVEIVLRYFPLHLLPEWRSRGGAFGQAAVAERIWFNELVNLPLYPALTDWQIEYLADAVEASLASMRRRPAVPRRPRPAAAAAGES